MMKKYIVQQDLKAGQIVDNPNDYFLLKDDRPKVYDIYIERGYVVYRISGDELLHQISLTRLAELLIEGNKMGK